VFSILFKPSFRAEQVEAFVDALQMFKIGFSWGGVTSLALVYPELDRPGYNYGGKLVRLNVGLEEPEDLIADLSRALALISECLLPESNRKKGP
jgi:cystathionine beta-lyase